MTIYCSIFLYLTIYFILFFADLWSKASQTHCTYKKPNWICLFGGVLGLLINIFSAGYLIDGSDDLISSLVIYFCSQILEIVLAICIVVATQPKSSDKDKAVWNWEVAVLLLFYCGTYLPLFCNC